MTGRKTIRIPALLALLVGLSGCVSPPPPKEVFYRFDPPNAGTVKGPGKFDKLRVQPLRATGILSERALQFSRTGTPGKIEQYRYHHWAKPPAQLLTDDLMVFLQQNKLAAQVIGSDVRAEATLNVDGELLRLERILGDSNGQVGVEILLRVQHYRSRELVLQKRYSETAKVKGKGMTAVVQAMSRARQRIFLKFAQDLRALPSQTGK